MDYITARDSVIVTSSLCIPLEFVSRSARSSYFATERSHGKTPVRRLNNQ